MIFRIIAMFKVKEEGYVDPANYCALAGTCKADAIDNKIKNINVNMKLNGFLGQECGSDGEEIGNVISIPAKILETTIVKFKAQRID